MFNMNLGTDIEVTMRSYRTEDLRCQRTTAPGLLVGAESSRVELSGLLGLELFIVVQSWAV